MRRHQVGRDFETHRPRPARHDQIHGAARGGVQVLGPLGHDHVLRDRAEQRGLFLQLVQHAQPLADLGRLDVGGHHQHRRAAAPRFLQRRDGEAGARAGRRDDNARAAARPRVAVGHVRGRGLVGGRRRTGTPARGATPRTGRCCGCWECRRRSWRGFGQGVQDSVRGAGHTLSVSPRTSLRHRPRVARPPRRECPTRAGFPPCAGPASAAAGAPRPASSSVSPERRRP